MKRSFLPLIAGAALAGTAGAASAIPFTITGGTVTPTGISVGPTVEAYVSKDLAHTFYLDEGETTDRFNFIDVSVTGLGLTLGAIDAEMTFDEPTVATAQGVLAGFSVILGFVSGGVLTVLQDPGPI